MIRIAVERGSGMVGWLVGMRGGLFGVVEMILVCAEMLVGGFGVGSFELVSRDSNC